MATRTFTAKCPAGATGEQVTVTKQARSEISMAHAEAEAARIAECEARALLECCWPATAAAVGSFRRVEMATVCSSISLDDAKQRALELAALHANQYVATAEYTATCPEGQSGTPVTVTRTAYSSVSQEDAQAQAEALAEAEAEAALVCEAEGN